MSTPDSRLDALETRIAYQDEVIDELNKTVTAQWQEIDKLTREVAKLAERVTQAEQTSGADDPADEPPPPHY